MNQSVVIVVDDAHRTAANAALAAYYGDVPGSPEISVPLSPTGQAPATYWGSHIWLSPTRATEVKDWPTGSLPLPTDPSADAYGPGDIPATPAELWAVHGLTEASALEAGSHLIVSVMSANESNMQTLPMTNFLAMLAALQVQRIT